MEEEEEVLVGPVGRFDRRVRGSSLKVKEVCMVVVEEEQVVVDGEELNRLVTVLLPLCQNFGPRNIIETNKSQSIPSAIGTGGTLWLLTPQA